MPKQPRVLRAKRQIIGDLTIVNPRAAGIDAGSEQHFVSVPENLDTEPVRAALDTFEKKNDPAKLPKKTRQKRRKNQLHFDARPLLYQIAGVDLTATDGLDSSSVLTILAETGTDTSPWRTADDFASWLALVPNRWITGGKPIAKKPPVIRPNRAAQAFRLAAQTLERAQCGVGAFFRRIQSRHGRSAAIKATAHKLAVIFYSMLKNQTEYRDPGVSYYEERYREKMLNSLKKKAATFGLQLTPI